MGKQDTDARRKKMVAKYKQGFSLREVGAIYGVTPQAVSAAIKLLEPKAMRQTKAALRTFNKNRRPRF